MGDRHAGVGVLHVVWFNYPTYLAAVVVIGAATAMFSIGSPPAIVAALSWLGGLVTTWWLAASITASAWVFRWSGVTRWNWLEASLGRAPMSFTNITAGFDDTTERLRRLFPDAVGTAIDIYDQADNHDGALHRARAAFPPPSASIRPGIALPIADASQDAVLLLMSAHELDPDHDRPATFAEVTRVLRPGGHLVVVEFPRSVVNGLTFGPGAWHFESAATWRGAAGRAGLRRVQERSLTPFVRTFLFEQAIDER